MNSSLQILLLIFVGGLLGTIGQSVRVIVGMKKVNDTKDPGTKFGDSLDTKRIWVSLLIGFVAGSLGVLSMIDWKTDPAKCSDCIVGIIWRDSKTISMLIAIGYAGTDAIEAFIRKNTA